MSTRSDVCTDRPCSTCVQAKSNATNVVSSSRRVWRQSRTDFQIYIHGDNQATPITNTRGRHTTRPQHTATMSIAPQRGAPPKRSSTVLVRHSQSILIHVPVSVLVSSLVVYAVLVQFTVDIGSQTGHRLARRIPLAKPPFGPAPEHRPCHLC
jgi:hypothetical protein